MTTASAPEKPHPGWRAWWVFLALLLAVAETGALKRVLPGDTLSETIWWIYGPVLGLRWWLLGCTVGALLTWAGLHFMWPPIAGRALVAVELVAVTVAISGWLATR